VFLHRLFFNLQYSTLCIKYVQKILTFHLLNIHFFG